MPNRNRHIHRMRAKREAFVRSLNIGEFAGRFSLNWVGPDLFHYTPDEEDPFRFIRNDKNGREIETIIPQPMQTDGGSVPKFVQALPGLAAWEYGPAYLIHDWEFEAHDRAREKEGFVFDKSFEDVNLTLAEGIWTLMKRGYLDYVKPDINKHNVYVIYQAVNSVIAKQIWDN